MSTSDKHNNNTNYFNLQGELTLLHYKEIETHWDMRMINYVIHSVRSTQPPLVISYPNLIPEHTYLWN